MARESEFIDRLSDFTKSLDNLVELLKEQQKIGPTEVVNQLLENIDAEAIAEIASNVEKVKENTIEINKNVEKTLEVVRSIKKERETGMFGEINDKKNKNTILDGVKTVILIAAGVLAIGLAFKIVGSVDFFSVVALGMGILFTAKAFATIASIKDGDGKPLTFKKSLVTAATLVIMAGAVMLAGFILNQMPVLGLMELITIVGVGATMGLATFFLLKAIKKLKPKTLMLAPLVPLIVPAIAAGLVAAGLILQQMPFVPLVRIISALGVGIALAPIAIAFGYLAKGLKNASIIDIIFAGIAVPIMARGIRAASWILQDVADIPMMKVIKAGIGIGLAILGMVPTIYILQKAGLLKPKAMKDLAIGIVSVILLSTAIMLSSWIITIGNYEDNYPSFDWALGVGLAMILFLPAQIAGGLMSMADGGFTLLMGLIGTVLVATGIMLSSHILGLGNYGTYPGLDWSLGVGLSMVAFGGGMILLGAMIVGSWGFGLLILAAGIGGMLMVADAIVQAAEILGKGKYDKYPTLEWSEGVGKSIKAFSEVMIELTKLQMLQGMFSFFFGGGSDIDLPEFIINVSGALFEAGKMFNSGPNVFGGNYPTEDWAAGVGNSIRVFSEVLIELTKLQMLKDMFSFFGSGGDIDLPAFIKSTAGALIDAGKIFQSAPDVFNGNYPSEEWAKGVGGSIKSFAQAIAAMDEAGIDTDADDLYDDDGMISVMVGTAKALIKVGKYMNKHGIEFDLSKVPAPEWAQGVGDSINAFAQAIMAMDEAGVDIDADDLYDDDGMISVMLGVAEGLVRVGRYFNRSGMEFKLDKVPSPEWATGVGETIRVFAEASEGLTFGQMWLLEEVADTMKTVARKFAIMKDYEIPPETWIDNFLHLVKKNVRTMVSVGAWMVEIIPDDFNWVMRRYETVTETMRYIAEDFSEMAQFVQPDEQWNKNFLKQIRDNVFNMVSVAKWMTMIIPEDFNWTLRRHITVAKTMYDFAKWMYKIKEDFDNSFVIGAKLVAMSVREIIEALPKQEEIDPLWSLIDALDELSNVSWDDLFDIRIVADVIGHLANQIEKLNDEKIESLGKLGAGLHIVALVDDTKLRSTLDTIEEKSDALKEIIDERSYIRRLFDSIADSYYEREKVANQVIANKPGESSDFEEKLLEYVKNIDINITKMSDINVEEREEELKSRNVEDDR